MADKSPRQHLSNKAGKSLKELRAEKHLKPEARTRPKSCRRASTERDDSTPLRPTPRGPICLPLLMLRPWEAGGEVVRQLQPP